MTTFAIACDGPLDLHRPVSARHGLEHQRLEQPHRAERGRRRVLAQGHDRRGDRLPARWCCCTRGGRTTSSAGACRSQTWRAPRRRRRGARRRPGLRDPLGHLRRGSSVRALDPRLLRRARPAPASRWAWTPGSACSPPCCSSPRRCCSRTSSSSAFAGRDLGRRRHHDPPVRRGGLRASRGRRRVRIDRAAGGRAGHERPAARARPSGACATRRSRPTGRRPARWRPPPSRASTRSRRTSRATFRSSSWRPSFRSSSWHGPSRSTRASALIMLITLPLIPVFMVLIGRATAGADPGALACPGAAVEPLPGRGAGAPHAARVQPGAGAGRAPRRDERGVPRGHDGGPPRLVPLRRGARPPRDARDRAGRGDARRPAHRRNGDPARRAHRPAAHPRAVRAAARDGRAVPRKRGRARCRRADPRPDRRPSGRGARNGGARTVGGDSSLGRVGRACRDGVSPCWTVSTWRFAAERSSPWWGRAAPGRAPSPTCSSASSRPTSETSPWTGSASRSSTRPPGGARSDGCRSGPTLFRGSVRDNIAMGAPLAGDQEIRDASALAAADEFVADLRHGYDTRLGRRRPGVVVR